MPADGPGPTVLIVDDQEAVAEVYRIRLRDDYDVRIATGGREALEAVDEDVSVVLLDRRMPGLAGDEVLAEIRDRALDVRVIMLTAVDPDFDILEMDFDDYLCKPVEKDDVVRAIEQQLTAVAYDERLSEYLEAATKRALLETQKSSRELAESEEFQRVSERASALRSVLDETLAEFDNFQAAFEEIGRQPG